MAHKDNDGFLPPISQTRNGSIEMESYLANPPPNNPTLTTKEERSDSLDDYETLGANTLTNVDLDGSHLDLGLSDDDKQSHVKFKNNAISPDSTHTQLGTGNPLVDIHDGFVIEFYVLDRQGRRLQDARNPDRDPPPLCRLKDKSGLVATTKSGMILDADININVIDTEIEARLLNLGRPLPSQIALYGWTSWGKTPLQCAVADGTLGERNVRTYVDRFLSDDALPRCSLETMRLRSNQENLNPSGWSEDAAGGEGSGDGGNVTPPRSREESFSSAAPTPSASHVPPQVNGFNIPEVPSAEPTVPMEASEVDIVDGSSELDFISPQLTSLRTNGRSMTLRELVQMGYLEPIESRRRTALSDKANSSERQGDGPDSQRDEMLVNEKLPHRNVFAIEIMFDEMRTGLQRKMPDINASAPHGEGSSVFAVTDDVPVDVRIDLINMIRVDLDDAYFEVDFDMTFSWLTRMPPFKVDEKLHREAKKKKLEGSQNNNYDSFAAANTFEANSPVRAVGEGAVGTAGANAETDPSASKKLWRPQWRFTNRVSDDGEVTEKIFVSERQKMARGMRLPKNIVEGYWPYGNPTRDELEDASADAIKKFRAELDPNKSKSFYMKGKGSSKSVGNSTPRFTVTKEHEMKSIAESFDILTRRTGGQNAALGSSTPVGGGGGTFTTPNTLANSASNSADEGVEGVTEVVFKILSRCLRFSLENQKLENFPFDTLSLPILISFREPMGCYQASIARTLKDGDTRKSTSNTFLDATSESENDDTDDSCSDMETSTERAFVSMKNRISKRVTVPFYSLLVGGKNNEGSDTKSKLTSKVAPESSSTNSLKSPSAQAQAFSKASQDVLAASGETITDLIFGEIENTTEILKAAQSSLREIKENDAVSIPSFRPAIDFVPIPGRLRLRVSNDYVNDGVAEHKLRSYKWGIEDLYVQKSKRDPKHDAFMQINVRAESVHELQHRWASPVMAIRVHVHRKSNYVLQYIYLPLFLMTFVSLNTILVGYGMDLVSAFGDRCSITLTLLLTVVATELPDHLKEVAQVKDLKVWAFQFIVFIIFKDIVATCAWWPTTYWHSAEIAAYSPWQDSGVSTSGDRLRNNFYGGEEFPWWHRIWFVDGCCTVLCLVAWARQLLVLCFLPRANWEGQQTAAVVRFEAEPHEGAQLLTSGSFLRHFIMERAANFLHDRWRAGYAQQCKKSFVADQRRIQKRAAQRKSSASLPLREKPPPPRTSPFPVTKGRVGVNRRASAIWVNEQLRTGMLEVPPRWKHMTTYQNPPPFGTAPPTTRHHSGIGAPGKWKDPATGEWYVNIDQKLEKLPECAMIDNLASADSVITMLEKTPHAPRTELAYELHRQWVDRQTDVSDDDKLRKPWSEIPLPDKIKNMVIINAVLDMCALAHQVHATVSSLFNKDGDGQVSSDEFLGGEALKPLFHDNVRVPVRKGDIVRVRDLCRNSDVSKQAVVVAWQQRSHWNHGDIKKVRRPSLNVNKSFCETKTDNENEEDDTFVDTIEADVESDDFQFHGTVFLVRIFKPSERAEFSNGIILPRPQAPHLDELLRRGELHAVPETALCWKNIRCDEFVKAILAHSDWLFDSDGTCSVNDHRCVPIARVDKKK